ncbi:MAG: DUF2281 domain-containing protein [Acidobacteria bacterium]|nr:DUF2281 domain-containing protein [Acidobacteriota bacterium]
MQLEFSELTPQTQELLSNIQPGEELLITAENQTVAKIVRVNGLGVQPNGEKPKRRRAGTAKGNFWMSPDFNEPLEDFKEYMP